VCPANARTPRAKFILEDAEMSAKFGTGQVVTLVKIPEWLLNDLPIGEQEEIRKFIGLKTTITEVDKYGYFWLGFGRTDDAGDEALYSGHSFCVTEDCLTA
jgi:hypothetical protein